MRGGVLAWGAISASTLSCAFPAAAVDGKLAAYNYAMRCFTANAVAINRQAENPQGTQTNAIREKAKHDHDVAYQMGDLLGFTEKQISDDFDRAQATEVRLLAAEPAYYARTKSECSKLGLM